ncbi:hypothetical protein DUZ99_11595 [Xylanibacillus composti]|uniref:Uncharacterized protein n=1 Tax=Xylanibacillus composti TaxID=1572762 RepID=A0A8J4GYX4_9BACL|nr:hypothetical protein [Xylanibacillus composti]MDT9725616.1 hypothetical protein [Xylanibacillus composti]GIQ67709.1 hypothetical protein XYCOK13_05330 [Xylanibacillus composti]
MSEAIEAMRRSIKQKQMQRLFQMEPGRELDALIARYVEGYQVVRRSLQDMDADYWIRPLSSMRSEEGELERVPTYSTTIFSAHALLNRYRQWRLQSEGEAGIQAEICGDEGAVGSSGACRTVPEAISKAAVALMIAENHLIEELLEEHGDAI